MTEAQDATGQDSPLIRLCINCDTENPAGAVLCSGCGMSLTRAPIGETAEKARNVAGVPDTTDQEQERKRHLPWGLRLAGMACWTVLVAFAGVNVAMLAAIDCAIGASWTWRQSPFCNHYQLAVTITIFAATALALAPWIAGGIVLARRWRRSRTPATPQATE